MTDVTQALAAKSDQLNADDLIAGPKTIRITKVKVDSSAEQKITVNFEGDGGKSWKPCKTAGRCLAAIWGPDSSKWVGKSCTLFRDDTVTWAGAIVGGIRVSHIEGITKPRSLNLAKARNKKCEVIILPLVFNERASASIDTANICEKIQAADTPDALKQIWDEAKKLCTDTQDYQSLEIIKNAVTEKNNQLKKGNENA